MLRWQQNTQMLLYLPKDGSMLGLRGNKLILMCTYDCYLLDSQAHMESAGPLQCVWLLRYHGVHQ